jgi:ElaB/YqjD/DUF883 family membrane-anchored ribosome-binding protein
MDDRKKSNYETTKAHVSDAASELLHESKKLVNDLYEDGMQHVHEAQESVKEYSDELSKRVRRNPLGSILIAAGIGFLLSSILRK